MITQLLFGLMLMFSSAHPSEFVPTMSDQLAVLPGNEEEIRTLTRRERRKGKK